MGIYHNTYLEQIEPKLWEITLDHVLLIQSKIPANTFWAAPTATQTWNYAHGGKIVLEAFWTRLWGQPISYLQQTVMGPGRVCGSGVTAGLNQTSQDSAPLWWSEQFPWEDRSCQVQILQESFHDPGCESGPLSIYCYLTWAAVVRAVNITPALLSSFLHDLTNLQSSA